LTERGYFKVPHLSNWFILVRFVIFIVSLYVIFHLPILNSILF
jgi:hypothetical protein